ncbi:MAG TPA: hydrogenase maturation nickel metallochaperone HypA [Terracidiphilus sp.]|nr:hydrogenase maturation nickel metallochaperone HypA [Terracidiphilus sp.]
MHEIGIANAILESVRSECARHPDARPCKVGVRVGELAGVDLDALQFAFEVLIRDTDLAEIELDLQFCSRQYHCSACGTEFSAQDYDLCCPQCGEERARLISGDELKLSYLEMEDHESHPA